MSSDPPFSVYFITRVFHNDDDDFDDVVDGDDDNDGDGDDGDEDEEVCDHCG